VLVARQQPTSLKQPKTGQKPQKNRIFKGFALGICNWSQGFPILPIKRIGGEFQFGGILNG